MHMFKSRSLTISALFVGLLATLVPLGEAESVVQGLQIIVEQLFIILPILLAWWGRLRVGDVTPTGKRK